jgi:hypothetical protein
VRLTGRHCDVGEALETAEGFVFNALEDYHGLINIIIRPALVPRFRG